MTQKIICDCCETVRTAGDTSWFRMELTQGDEYVFFDFCSFQCASDKLLTLYRAQYSIERVREF